MPRALGNLQLHGRCVLSGASMSLKFRDKRLQKPRLFLTCFIIPTPIKLQLENCRWHYYHGRNGLVLLIDRFDEASSYKRTMDSILLYCLGDKYLWSWLSDPVVYSTRLSVGFGNKEIDEYIKCGFSNQLSQISRSTSPSIPTSTVWCTCHWTQL